jgi:hypothetical protein
MMLQALLQTDTNFVNLFLQLVAGIIIVPYRMQKLFGWYEDMGEGVGVHNSPRYLSDLLRSLTVQTKVKRSKQNQDGSPVYTRIIIDALTDEVSLQVRVKDGGT